MSIPPKYGRVYTRINGGVSCKAITFPFLRFRCAHEGKGARDKKGEGKRETEGGGQTPSERAKERERNKGRSKDQEKVGRRREERRQICLYV